MGYVAAGGTGGTGGATTAAPVRFALVRGMTVRVVRTVAVRAAPLAAVAAVAAVLMRTVAVAAVAVLVVAVAAVAAVLMRVVAVRAAPMIAVAAAAVRAVRVVAMRVGAVRAMAVRVAPTIAVAAAAVRAVPVAAVAVPTVAGAAVAALIRAVAVRASMPVGDDPFQKRKQLFALSLFERRKQRAVCFRTLGHDGMRLARPRIGQTHNRSPAIQFARFALDQAGSLHLPQQLAQGPWADIQFPREDPLAHLAVVGFEHGKHAAPACRRILAMREQVCGVAKHARKALVNACGSVAASLPARAARKARPAWAVVTLPHTPAGRTAFALQPFPATALKVVQRAEHMAPRAPPFRLSCKIAISIRENILFATVRFIHGNSYRK